MVLFPIMAQAKEESYFIRGIVRDNNTDEAVEGAFVTVGESARGVMTDADGIFEITAPRNASVLTVRCLGYEPFSQKIAKNNVNLYAVYLKPQALMLGEVVVTKKEKYSKKNNPAVDLMEHIRRTAHKGDPKEKPYYNYKTYQRTTLALADIDPSSEKGLLARFPALHEHLDTSQISGKPILPISLREQSASVHFRSNPRATRTIITGSRSDGIDEMLDRESMNRFVNDILGPVDVFAADINLLQNRFVSPLSPIAADFYKFFLNDTILGEDGCKYVILSFYPHNKATFGFNGTMEVTTTDTTSFVRSITMRVPSEINLNFIENLTIHQTFSRTPDGIRIPLTDDIVIEASLIPGTQGLYAHRVIDYSEYSFERPVDESSIFRPSLTLTTSPDASRRDSVFWQEVNPAGLSQGERNVSKLMERLRTNKVFYWGEKVVMALVKGYIPTAPVDKSKFDIGPLNTFVSANPLEGARFRAGGITTANLNPHWFARIYGAWGTKDHRWKYGLELEYSINRKQRHTREFPVHSLRLTSLYDTDRPGQQYAFTNPDNVFLSLHRPGIDPMTYHRVNSLLYTLELQNHFSVKASIKNERQYDSPQMRFDLSGGGRVGHYDVSSAAIELRYAPHETFYQTTNNRIPINQDHPVVTLTQTFAPHTFGNFGTVNSTLATYMQRFWFSAFGYLDVMAKAGHVWSRHTPFNHLFIANTNLSYTIQPESFALTSPMEFVADSYGDLELTYWANGALLNYIPYVKKLKLREVFSIHGFYGALSSGNNPARTPGLIQWPGCGTVAERLRTPYLEASVGLDNICRILRVDYVWRLTHRHLPIEGGQRWGIRIALHFTF